MSPPALSVRLMCSPNEGTTLGSGQRDRQAVRLVVLGSYSELTYLMYSLSENNNHTAFKT